MADSQEGLLLKIQEQGDLVRKLKAAKESNERGKGFKEVYNFEEIDKHLSHYSYICGYVPSKPDVDVAKALKSLDFSNYKYIKRWWNHMRSFSDTEVTLFPDFRQPNF